MLSGESVSEMTFMPEPCAEAMSMRASGCPPSASSRQLSDTLRTASMASEVLTWPVTVSASMSRTERPRRVCRAAARFVAIVVLPTPPFGLKTAMTVARRVFQPSTPMSPPPWMIGLPLPSSMVWLRMHMASIRQRIASAVNGRVRYSSSAPAELLVQRSKESGATTISAGTWRDASFRAA